LATIGSRSTGEGSADMKVIGDLLVRPLSQKIEEIIKVDQSDESTVRTELKEYIATERIREEYHELFKAVADGLSEPSEAVGVWISGFFGSGKSSFAKNLGYVLANREVLGEPAAELFKDVVADDRISALVDVINRRIPTEVVMFDVSVVRGVRTATERIAEIMYRALLGHLDYAEDFDIAELEITLEGDGQLEEFIRLCKARGWDWNTSRKSAFKISRASAILHDMDEKTFPAADSFARSMGTRQTDINVATFVDRAFELTARRKPGKALVFIIDEVGQYVARSADKIEDLRAVVEQFGKEGKNRLKAETVPAPGWIVVTSQEKLEEVVDLIDSKRVGLAKLQDRFKYHVDLAPSDIREVASKRVLAKHEAGGEALKQLYQRNRGQLEAAVQLENTARKTSIQEADFVQFYPYLPHFIDLSIDIMSGIRLQPGAPRHFAGSNRTIIKQAYEMLVSEHTHMATRPIGALVSMDLIYELVEGNLSTEKRKDISDIAQRFADDIWPLRVAKALALLEFVRNLPRTEKNIAAVLVDEVGKPAPLPQTTAALEQLVQSEFVRNTEEGYKLQTAQEKSWETERRSLEPKPRERNEIIRDVLGDIFSEPYLKTHRFENLRSFRVGVSVNGARLGDEGHIPLALTVADAPGELGERVTQARAGSQSKEHRNNIYWVFALTPAIDGLVANLFASMQMVAKYDQVRAQNNISNDAASSLGNEKAEVVRLKDRLHREIQIAVDAGQAVFRGVLHDASSLGKTSREIFKQLFDLVIPDLYPRLEMGARALSGDETAEFLKAANLQALPQVFYGGEEGLGLVVQDGNKYVPNPHADIAREVLEYMRREQDYGTRVTGKSLEDHFGGLGYGWDNEVLRVVLAVLLRGGYVEVTHQGQRFRNAVDPQSRVPFEKIPAFRSASFAPRESIDMRTLTKAVEHYEDLTGAEVDVEEAAIAERFQELANQEKEELLPLAAVANAQRLPVTATLEEYRQTLEAILAAASDDRVRILAGEGGSFKEARARVRQIRNSLSHVHLQLIEQARLAIDEMWTALEPRGDQQLAQGREELAELVRAEDFYVHLRQISHLTLLLQGAYRDAYEERHADRFEQYSQVIEGIKGMREWPLVPEDLTGAVLLPLSRRAHERVDMPANQSRCRGCGATLPQMESDVAALSTLTAQVRQRVDGLVADPAEDEQRAIRVRAAEFFPEPLDSRDTAKAAVDVFLGYLLDLVEEEIRVIVE
jgi:hypothetical protein